MKLKVAKASVEGPFAKIEQSYELGRSTLTQTVSLAAGSKLLRFSSKASWRETNSMLRTKFPVDVFAESANFEIQFGHIARPTHSNTSWDMAKDEVAAHKWADLSERDFGVALLNDCKYGHKVKGATLDLDLIRSLPHPGAKAFDEKGLKPGEPNHRFGDQCEHEFEYALYPHKGGLVEGEVVRRAYEFNVPLGDFAGGSGTEELEASTLSLDSKDVIVEAVKRSEDGRKTVLRLYEASRSRAKAKLALGFKAKSVHEANLLEEPQGKLKLSGGVVELDFKPFEIKTVLIES